MGLRWNCPAIISFIPLASFLFTCPVSSPLTVTVQQFKVALRPGPMALQCKAGQLSPQCPDCSINWDGEILPHVGLSRVRAHTTPLLPTPSMASCPSALTFRKLVSGLRTPRGSFSMWSRLLGVYYIKAWSSGSQT